MPSCVCFSDMCLHSKTSKIRTTERGEKRDHFGKCADICSLIIPEYITSKLFLLPSGSEYTKVYPSRAFGFFSLSEVGGQKGSAAKPVAWGRPDRVCNLQNVLSFDSANQWLVAQALWSSKTSAEDPET